MLVYTTVAIALLAVSAIGLAWVAAALSRLAKDPRFAPELTSIVRAHRIWVAVMAFGFAFLLVAVWPTFQEMMGAFE